MQRRKHKPAATAAQAGTQTTGEALDFAFSVLQQHQQSGDPRAQIAGA